MLSDYFEVYKKANLRMYEFSLLVLIYEDSREFLEEIYKNNFIDFDTGIRYLETMGYIKRHGETVGDIMLRKAGETLFSAITKREEKRKPKSGVHLWFDEWRNLFPEGSNNAGYRYRGNRLEGLKKMVKFVSTYPEFTKEEIYEATRNYVNKFAIRGYNYMQQAHYFIEKKDVGSTLASECEGLKEKGTRLTQKPSEHERLI